MSRMTSTREPAPRVSTARPIPSVVEPSPCGKVVPLRLHVLPRHRAYLQAWVTAGARMGLCDADVGTGRDAEIFIWVRENADPAYVVRAQGFSWVVYDHLRERKLGAFRDFEAALFCIRPIAISAEIAA